MIKKVNKNEDRKVRALRVRKKVSGTPERPRLNVFRSLNQIYCQIIDDTNQSLFCSLYIITLRSKEGITF